MKLVGQRLLSQQSLQELISEKYWYDMGTPSDIEELFDAIAYVDMTEEHVLEVAINIYNHSSNLKDYLHGCNEEQILIALCNEIAGKINTYYFDENTDIGCFFSKVTYSIRACKRIF